MIPRREVLKSLSLLGATGPIWFGSAALSGNQLQGNHVMAVSDLIAALRETGKQVCQLAASRLEAEGFEKSGFDLHLRSGGLSADDALAIAAALAELGDHPASALRSVSISYNQDIGEAGAAALIRSFPATVTEIGMVGCDLGDESGEALLKFALSTPKLKMMCVEGNSFSPPMHQRFKALHHVRADMLLVA